MSAILIPKAVIIFKHNTKQVQASQRKHANHHETSNSHVSISPSSNLIRNSVHMSQIKWAPGYHTITSEWHLHSPTCIKVLIRQIVEGDHASRVSQWPRGEKNEILKLVHVIRSGNINSIINNYFQRCYAVTFSDTPS